MILNKKKVNNKVSLNKKQQKKVKQQKAIPLEEIKKNKKKDILEEEILSDQESELEYNIQEQENKKKNKILHGQDNLNGFEEENEEEETVDQKRNRLAKQILNNAKLELKQEKRNYKNEQNQEKEYDFEAVKNDEFFLLNEKKDREDMNDKFDFVPVHRDDDEQVQDYDHDDLTKTLQQKIMKKRNLIFNNYADKLQQVYRAKNGKFESIELKGHKRCITCLEIDYFNKTLYSASKDSSIIKWDLEKQQKTIFNYGKEKDPSGHYDEILTMSLNFDSKYLVTAGKDRMIKIWDTKSNKLIDTLKGHRDTIQGLKFQLNSNQFCSISCDKTFKMWDAQEKAYLDTYYGHANHINTIDSIGSNDFVTGGFDRQAIYWKIEDATQLIYNGHNYSIDCIKSIDNEYFVSGSQDSTIGLWHTKKKKPITYLENMHEDSWITALGNIYNSDLLASGAYNEKLNFYKINLLDKDPNNKILKMFELPSKGIINDIKFASDASFVAYIESDEHKLGRWITNKAKNRIKIYKFF